MVNKQIHLHHPQVTWLGFQPWSPEVTGVAGNGAGREGDQGHWQQKHVCVFLRTT